MPIAFDPIGIGEPASYLILGGAVTIALLATGIALWLFWDFRSTPDYDELGQGIPIKRGSVLFPLYLRDEDLSAIAAQKGIMGNPAWVEQGEGTESSSELTAAPKRIGFKSAKKRSAETRQHIELPRDKGGLVIKVLEKLGEADELRWQLALAPQMTESQHPVLTDPRATATFIDRYLSDRYPDGIDEPWETVVTEMVKALQQKALEELTERKRAEYQALDRDDFAVVEAEWRVARTADGVALNLAKFDRPGFVGVAVGGAPEPMPVPEGVHLVAFLDYGGLTDRGRRDFEGKEARRLGVFGTVKGYHWSSGVLEIDPIAVFSTSGGPAFLPPGYSDYYGSFVGG